MNFLVLHTRTYDFKNDDGERVKGTSVTYLDPEAPQLEDEQGHLPMKVNADADLSSHFPTAPAYYDLDFRQRAGRDGKPKVVLVGAKLQGAVNFQRQPAKAPA